MKRAYTTVARSGRRVYEREHTIVNPGIHFPVVTLLACLVPLGILVVAAAIVGIVMIARR